MRWGDGPEVRARAARSLLVEGASVGTATILVVDDERKIRDLVRSYLEREGYAVLLASRARCPVSATRTA